MIHPDATDFAAQADHGLPVDRNAVTTFVAAMFPYASPCVTLQLRVFAEGQQGPALKLQPHRFEDAAGLATAAAEVAQWAADHDAAAVFCPPLVGFSPPAGEETRAREQDVAEAYALTIECDVSPAASVARVAAIIGPPTVLVASGGEWINPDTGEVEPKLHAHWRLNEPATGDQLVRLKQLRRLAADYAGADPSAVPLAHPMRWPGSWHRKGAPKLARIVELRADAEIELDDALDRLAEAVGRADPPANADANGPDTGGGEYAALVANILAGRDLHDSIVRCAAALVASGAHPGAAVNHLRALMEQTPADRRDLRWHARYGDIPRAVQTAVDKFSPQAAGVSAEQQAKPEAAAAAPEIFPASRFAGRPVPPREWQVPEVMPAATVTLLGGDGGVGKSTAALQLCVATVTGKLWLGRTPRQGPALYLSSEDDEGELHRRLHEAAMFYDVGLDQLGDLHLWPMADRDAVLGTAPRNGQIIEPTALWETALQAANDLKPRLIILDSLADVFGGDENNRGQARQFVGLLRRAAIATGAAVVPLAHPSLTGLNSGTGTSGSTGWSNSVRSRLYMSAVNDNDGPSDPDLRILSLKKSNYARAIPDMRLRRRIGGYMLEDDGRQGGLAGVAAAEGRVERVFLDLVATYTAQGRNVSPNPGPTYAPALFAKDPQAKGCAKAGLAAAMNRLLHQGRLRVETGGPPSRPHHWLVITEGRE